ncbi:MULTISPECIES: hypothetical protein [unclassified Streptomyces]|nr:MULTISPECIES: hypothetical protein [unclassified Streptomyces]WSB75103.1 hypothetical protein OHB04_04460 [Streptomyces sp. NBC_01775]WSS16614.1 hypothetical protein OG533_35440 [Streptomyces sp. NBC_01186]WSS45432.1 hypothetical protein OG220_36125 [Streptomyces sp. NBC_01187]
MPRRDPKSSTDPAHPDSPGGRPRGAAVVEVADGDVDALGEAGASRVADA